MHGGARGSGVPRGAASAAYKTGLLTCEALEARRQIRSLIADALAFMDDLQD